MTLQTQFDQQLSGLGTGAATLAVDNSQRKVSCSIIEHNQLAVSFDQLCLTTGELADANPGDLKRIGTTLSERLTYLMEPIRPIELDADACTVQMRSSPPQRDDDGRSYYELVVRRGGELNLCRYRKEPGKPRQQVAATVTGEALLRLVDDFEAVLG